MVEVISNPVGSAELGSSAFAFRVAERAARECAYYSQGIVAIKAELKGKQLSLPTLVNCTESWVSPILDSIMAHRRYHERVSADGAGRKYGRAKRSA